MPPPLCPPPRQTLHALAVPRHDGATMQALLRSVGTVMGHPYWRVRVAGLAFLQATAFHNMFLLLGHRDAAQTVRRRRGRCGTGGAVGVRP